LLALAISLPQDFERKFLASGEALLHNSDPASIHRVTERLKRPLQRGPPVIARMAGHARIAQHAGPLPVVTSRCADWRNPPFCKQI
jgi:hypothetical protein